MKKYSKYVGLSYYFLTALAFLLLFISGIVGLGNLPYDSNTPIASIVIMLIIRIILAVGVMFLAVKGGYEIIKKLSSLDSYNDKTTISIIGGFHVLEILTAILTMIYISSLGNALGIKAPVGGEVVAELIIGIIGSAAIVVALLVKKLPNAAKFGLVFLAFVLAFVLCCMSFGDYTGLLLAYLIIFFIAIIAGVVYYVIENFDLLK